MENKQYIGMLEKILQDELLRAELLEERVMVRKELNAIKRIKKESREHAMRYIDESSLH